jgi:hypothetical protein
MAAPTKAELEQVLRDGLAVLDETRRLSTDDTLDGPERRRASERCWWALDCGAALGFWEPVPAEVRARAGRR